MLVTAATTKLPTTTTTPSGGLPFTQQDAFQALIGPLVFVVLVIIVILVLLVRSMRRPVRVNQQQLPQHRHSTPIQSQKSATTQPPRIAFVDVDNGVDALPLARIEPLNDRSLVMYSPPFVSYCIR
jgi:flagellar biosynthesis/type III secretory pathway M-ring protein FliF/YscJ